MTYQALYREWRPPSFADVVGQRHVVTTLQNALRAGRLAHAYLFAGPRGTGKTSLAKILAKAVNCENAPPEEPCNECAACRSISLGRTVDVIEMDAASNRGVDEIRSLLDQVRYAPTEVRRKVYIVDEVHMLTTEAWNALLKTLEEPPDYVLFILATTDPQRVPATILSRCQRFDFGRVSTELVVERLRLVAQSLSGAQVEDVALWYIARVTEGGLRDALSLLDQTASFANGRIDVEAVSAVLGGMPSERLGELFDAAANGDAGAILRQLGAAWERGVDPGQLLAELVAYGRDAIVWKQGVQVADAGERARFDPTFPVVVGHIGAARAFALIDRLARMQSELRFQSQPRIYLEVQLLALGVDGDPGQQAGIAELIRRVDALEAALQARQMNPSTGLPDAPVVALPTGTESSAGLQQVRSGRAETAAATAASAAQATPAAARPVPALRSPAAPAVPDAEAVALFARAEAEWTALLDDLKQRSVQTRAWLHSGTPVAVQDGAIIVAFKGKVHADTVMREPHRRLIEQALSERFGRDLSLRTVLADDWRMEERPPSVASSTKTLPEPVADAPVSAATPSVMRPEGGPEASRREDWVEKMVEWLGEDRVTILDE